MGRRTPAAERDLLDLLDEGEHLSVTERGVLLAQAASRAPGRSRTAGKDGDPAALPLGERDRLILRLHAELFGRILEAQDRCPQCGEIVTFTFTVEVLQQVPAAAPEPVRVEHDGYSVSCRLLTSGDVLAATHGEPVAARGRQAMLASAVISAERNGQPVGPADLPATVAAAVAGALAEADPFAEIRVRPACDACGHAWDAVLDLPDFVWRELRDWGQRLIRDVHVLAKAYGWREQEVLALPPSRRTVYLRLVRNE
jgi:hypothetical protein